MGTALHMAITLDDGDDFLFPGIAKFISDFSSLRQDAAQRTKRTTKFLT